MQSVACRALLGYPAVTATLQSFVAEDDSSIMMQTHSTPRKTAYISTRVAWKQGVRDGLYLLAPTAIHTTHRRLEVASFCKENIRCKAWHRNSTNMTQVGPSSAQSDLPGRAGTVILSSLTVPGVTVGPGRPIFKIPFKYGICAPVCATL